MKSSLEIVTSLIGIFIVIPIWFYLLYQILQRVQATELMMFLFWVYLPTHFLVGLTTKILSK